MTASATTKRILMFAPACFPPAGPEAIVNAKLVLALQQAGWSVDVIAEALELACAAGLLWTGRGLARMVKKRQ